MIFRVETDDLKRKRHAVPHRRFVLAAKVDGDYGALWIICRFVMRKWTDRIGYQYNIGDGIWRTLWTTFY